MTKSLFSVKYKMVEYLKFTKMRFCIVVVFSLAGFLAQGQISPKEARLFVSQHFKNISKKAALDSLLASSERLAEENPDTAYLLAGIAKSLSDANGDHEKSGRAAWCAAEAMYFKDEYQKAIDLYLVAAEEYFEVSRDSSGQMAEQFSNAAYCYQELGIPEKALELNKIALRLQRRAGNKAEIGTNLSNIGTNYFHLSDFDKAVEYFTMALQIDRTSGDSAAIGTSLNNLGMVYSRWGKHRQGIKFFEDALSFSTSESVKAIRYSNIGMSWYHLKDYEKALDYLYRALKTDIRLNRTVKIGIRKNEISTVISAMGRYHEALKLNEEALAIFRETGITESQIITLTDMGSIYQKLGADDKAGACFLESAALAEKSGAVYHLARNYKALYELAEARSDFRNAFLYLKKYAAANDSVFNTEKHKQLANFEILYETEKKEKANQLLLLDLRLRQKTQRLGIVIIAGLMLVLLFTYLLLRAKSKGLKQHRLLLKKEQELAALELEKKDAANKMLEDRIFAEQQINRLEREKHSATLELKNNELANSSLNIVRKNEILNEIRDRIKTSRNNEVVHEIISFINSNTDIDHNWQKFKLEFDFIHPGFFDRIKSVYPQLTEHDIRLAAYLRINLSSREISGMMNVSLETVHKNRQRLRKKMNLEPNCDLSATLKAI